MPMDRLELYRNLVQLRMVYLDGGFRSHLDLFNKAIYGKYLGDASLDERRNMFNLWNMPATNGFLALNPLIEAGFICKMINNYDAESDIIFEYARKMDPPIIGISTTFILQWAEIGRIIKEIRKKIPDAIFIIGGAFVNDQYLTKGEESFEKPMRKFGISYTLFSFNSENDLMHLIKAIKKKEVHITGVNNMAFFDAKGFFTITKTCWNKPVLEATIRFSHIIDKNINTKTLQIRTSSGCPFKCAFCSYPIMSGGYHKSSLDVIRRQLDDIRQIENIEAIVFIDDTMNFPERRFREIVRLLKDYNFRWYSFYRAQYADEILANELKESGCDGLYLGLESGNDNILRNMNKKASVDGYRKGIEILKKYNISLFGMFVVGFPGETEKTVNDNIEFINNSGLDYFSVKEFFYLHTSPIHKMRHQFKLEGEGYKWKHKTMTSIQATELKLRMFEQINNSIHIDPDLGLWYLIYLRDRGFDWEKIRKCQNIVNIMIHNDNEGKYDNKEVLFTKFCNILKTQ